MGYDYTGSVVGVTLKKAGYYKLEVWGEQGGSQNSSYYAGGYGGYSYGSISFLPNVVLYLVVGGQGESSYTKNLSSCPNNSSTPTLTGGYNGGGSAMHCSTNEGAGGGGATHIASEAGLLASLSERKSSIIIVAGGGGGTGHDYGTSHGGHGGGYSGGDGTTWNTYGLGGKGGNQVSGGYMDSHPSVQGSFDPASFGKGESLIRITQNGGHISGCGGAGLYGGSCSGTLGGGGGGSGYLNTSKLVSGSYRMYCYASGDGACPTNSSYYTYAASGVSSTATANYAKQGNGYARITYLGTSI